MANCNSTGTWGDKFLSLVTTIPGVLTQFNGNGLEVKNTCIFKDVRLPFLHLL